MRALAYAAVFSIAVLAAGAASANPWNDPAGRLTIDVPRGWRVQPQQSSTSTYIKVGNAERECQIFATPNPASSAQSPGGLRHALQDDAQWTPERWQPLANSVTMVFPHQAQFVSRSQDSTNFWPVQRADFASPGTLGDPPLPVSVVHAGITVRPGMDIMGYCYTVSDPDYPTADNPAVFDPVLRSMGTPNDATLQATAEAAAAAAAAAAAPPPPPPPPTPAPQQGRQHH